MICSDSLEIAEKSLALSLLYIQRCNQKKAQEILESISTPHLRQILKENWEILFDSSVALQKTKTLTFSELTIMLFPICPDLLAELFVDLITQTRSVSLSKILKAFLDYLPASIGTDCNVASTVLQKTLELYFSKIFENADTTKMSLDRGANEALKILVRTYLSQLQILQLKEQKQCAAITKQAEDDKDGQQEKFKRYFEEGNLKSAKDGYLLCKSRWEYLDKMPPYQVEITSKLYESCSENYAVKEQNKPNEEADLVLKKLQALLCSQVLPKQVIAEVNTLLDLNGDLRGNISLRSITMNVNEAVAFLIDSCPQCLLQYGKVSALLLPRFD